jgi:hypothetical protein
VGCYGEPSITPGRPYAANCVRASRKSE